ncbi:MAG: hypothetical protein ACH37Z_11465 [Anaerolineae bacterium]
MGKKDQEKQAELLAQAEAAVTAAEGGQPAPVSAPPPAREGTLLECVATAVLPFGLVAGPGWKLLVTQGQVVTTNPKGVERTIDLKQPLPPGYAAQLVSSGKFRRI